MKTRMIRSMHTGAATLAVLALVAGPASAKEVRGTGGSDVLKGTSRADTMYGGGGADRMYGYKGNDSLYGGSGRDTVRGGGGADKVVGGAGKDDVKGGAGRDSLYGLDGDDVLRARDSFADKIYCGDGSDRAYVDRRDTFPTARASRPRGTCESIRWVNPWVLPVKLSAMPEGRSGLNDPHHDYPSVDLQAPTGTAIRAVRGGFVEAAGWAPLSQSWCGYGVVIRGVSGGQYMYCHMSQKPSVTRGMGIGAGRTIGKVGSTGNSSGPHLHLQIWAGTMGSDGYYNGRCPQRMLTAIAAGNTVPRPSQLPGSGCTY